MRRYHPSQFNCLDYLPSVSHISNLKRNLFHKIRVMTYHTIAISKHGYLSNRSHVSNNGTWPQRTLITPGIRWKASSTLQKHPPPNVACRACDRGDIAERVVSSSAEHQEVCAIAQVDAKTKATTTTNTWKRTLRPATAAIPTYQNTNYFNNVHYSANRRAEELIGVDQRDQMFAVNPSSFQPCRFYAFNPADSPAHNRWTLFKCYLV